MSRLTLCCFQHPVGQCQMCLGEIYSSVSTCQRRVCCAVMTNLTMTLTTWGIDGVPQLGVFPLAQLVLLGSSSRLGGLNLWTSDTGNREEERRKSATQSHSSELWDTGRTELLASIWTRVKKGLQVTFCINLKRGSRWLEFTDGVTLSKLQQILN